MLEIKPASSLWTRLMTFASNTTLLPNSPTPPMDPLAHPQRSTSLISLSQTNSIVSSPQLIEPITIPKRGSSLENTLHPTPSKPIVILRRRSSLVNRLSSATLDIGNGLLNDLQTADMSSNVNGREVDAESDRGNTLAVVKIDIVDKQPDITEKESNIVALQGESVAERDSDQLPALMEIPLDAEFQTKILQNEKASASATSCALLTSIPDTKAIEIAKVIDSPSLSPANSLLSPQPLPTTLQSQKVFVFGPDGRLCRDAKHTIHVVTVTPSSTSCQIKDTPIDHNDANSTAAQLQTLPSKTEPITSLKSVTSLSSPIKLSTAASTTITVNQQNYDPDIIISIPSPENPLLTSTIPDANIHPKNSSPLTKFGKIMKKCGLIFKSWIVEKKQRMLRKKKNY